MKKITLFLLLFSSFTYSQVSKDDLEFISLAKKYNKDLSLPDDFIDNVFIFNTPPFYDTKDYKLLAIAGNLHLSYSVHKDNATFYYVTKNISIVNDSIYTYMHYSTLSYELFSFSIDSELVYSKKIDKPL